MRATDGASFVGGGTLVMGGLWPERPLVLVDLCDAGLVGLSLGEDGLRIGAGVTVTRLRKALGAWIAERRLDGFGLGALTDALAAFSPTVVADVATVGGNIATGIGSLIGPLTLLDAVARVRRSDGATVVIPVAEAVTCPGLIETVELVPGSDSSAYMPLQRTPAGPAVVAVSVALRADSMAEVVVTVTGSFPQRVTIPVEPKDRVVSAMTRALGPFAGDPRASSRYRAAMAGVLVQRLVTRLTRTKP